MTDSFNSSVIDESLLRLQLLGTAKQLLECGLNRGTSGNVSVRSVKGLLITPSGIPVEELSPEGMVEMQTDGSVLSTGKPSSEWHFHCAIMAKRPEVRAIIHTHSIFATTLACQHQDIPPFHYMIAVAGGDTIRCAPYALFGTPELANNALVALENRQACLLANHGMIVIGADLASALARAVEVETLCEMYWRTLQGGQPKILSPEQMQAVHQQFIGYGSLGQNQKISVKK